MQAVSGRGAGEEEGLLAGSLGVSAALHVAAVVVLLGFATSLGADRLQRLERPRDLVQTPPVVISLEALAALDEEMAEGPSRPAPTAAEEQAPAESESEPMPERIAEAPAPAEPDPEPLPEPVAEAPEPPPPPAPKRERRWRRPAAKQKAPKVVEAAPPEAAPAPLGLSLEGDGGEPARGSAPVVMAMPSVSDDALGGTGGKPKPRTRLSAPKPPPREVREEDEEALARARAAESAWLRKVAGAVYADYRYPRRARRDGIEGEVVLAITIDSAGRVTGLSVARSSGHEILDRAALASARGVTRVPAPPAGIGWSTRTFELPVVYRLE